MRNRLTLAFFGVICLTLGLVYLLINRSSPQILQNSFRNNFERGIVNIVPQLEDYFADHDSWIGVDALLTPSYNINVTEDSIYRANSTDLVLMDFDGEIVAPATSAYYGVIMEEDVILEAEPLSVDGEIVGYLSSHMMIAKVSEVFIQEFNVLFSRSILMTLIASGFIAMIYALIATNLVVKPINDMTETVEKMAKGDLKIRVNPQKYGYQNLITLAESIKYLTRAVQQSESQRREMISDVAHELRTPLAVQQSYLEAMEDEIVPFNKDSLKIIQEQNLLLTRLVSDLRLLSEATAGELHLVVRQLDLAQILLNVIKAFSAKFDELDLKLNLKVDKQHPFILGDPDRIEQIINNLMQNETRYAPPGSELEIFCGIVNHQGVISVRDYGVGVPEEEQEAIFVRFFRTDKGKKAEPTGFGLGLPIARKLAEAHGGTLTAKTPEGKGVVFTLTLPLSFEPLPRAGHLKAPARKTDTAE